HRLPRDPHSFFLHCSAHHLDLHSFPTRRSSDLRSRDTRALHPKSPRLSRARRGGGRSLGGRQRLDRRLRANCTEARRPRESLGLDRKSTRLNSSHVAISYAVFCLKKKNRTKSWR